MEDGQLLKWFVNSSIVTVSSVVAVSVSALGTFGSSRFSFQAGRRYSISDQPLILAGILASMVPMIVIYLIGQRFFTSGLTAGALKGE
jgi:ABC-type glycerol-3-phosphate transport system permease component